MTPVRRWVDPNAGIPGRRTFVAVPLPDATVAAIAGIVDTVRSQGVPGGGRDVRWVRHDGLHLTLRFLGPTSEDRLGPTVEAVHLAARDSAPFEAELGGAGTFPSNGRPRTLWIGLTAGTDGLHRLAAGVDGALAAAGWPTDQRPFNPHLTLARADGIAAGRSVGERLAAAMAGQRVRFAVDRVTLFESVTGEGPARYVSLASADLGEPGSGPAVYHRANP